VVFLDERNGGGRRVRPGDAIMLHATSGDAIVVIGCVLALLAVLLPLLLGLGWRASLLLAAACYPLVVLAADAPGPPLGMLPETLGMGRMPSAAAHTVILTILYLPPLLVLCRGVTVAVPRAAWGGPRWPVRR
jgi:hypothetical protein